MTNLRELLQQSGVNNSELAAIMHVGRMSVWRWQHGVQPKQELTRVTCEKIVGLLRKAIDAGYLPLPEDVRHSERIGLIKRILKSLA